jgi:DNA recombination protein RmuC
MPSSGIISFSPIFYIAIAVFLVLVIAVVLLVVLLVKNSKSNQVSQSGNDELITQLKPLIEQINRTELGYAQDSILKAFGNGQTGLRTEMQQQNEGLRRELGDKLSKQMIESEQKFENIRNTMSESMREMREDNSKQLESMRQTVDEKLQKTLEERLGQSFKLVSERLEEVHKGLGDMQNLATGVGDLKKVLSNVKNRGILGEFQLGAILEEILSNEQYEENIATVSGSANRVEFAVKLPGGDDGSHVYLPIDAKFPGDAYANLMDAYDTADPGLVEAEQKKLKDAIKKAGKDISEKYVHAPETTDFAIMFLPVEGLYAEVVRLGLVGELQHLYKVNIAGPTTMAALLNSLQMGFKTLAIQQRSGEVWKVLSEVKVEFEKFGGALESARKKIVQADKELETLISTRSNVMNRKLRNVSSLADTDTTESALDMVDYSEDDDEIIIEYSEED